MPDRSPTADVNIHLRARVRDRDLIDRAAELAGTTRSQFMLASALNEAKNVLLDQTNLVVDARTFQKVLAWMDGEATPAEQDGIRRLLGREADWAHE